MKNTLIAFIAACLLFISFSALSASTKEEIIELKAQVAEMQTDLAEIKKLLQSGAARAPAQRAATPPFKEQTISIGSSPFKGKANATVTLIEFSDYQCPFCARNYRQVLPGLVEEYVDTGKLKFVMRENPIPSLHRNAVNASLAALCAKDQGRYWEMHDMLFDNQRDLVIDSLKSFAVSLELDAATFNECLDSEKYKQRINDDIASGAKFGITGTPGFVLGLTDPDDSDKALMKVFIKGAQSLDNFKREIDSLLKSVE